MFTLKYITHSEKMCGMILNLSAPLYRSPYTAEMNHTSIKGRAAQGREHKISSATFGSSICTILLFEKLSSPWTQISGL